MLKKLFVAGAALASVGAAIGFARGRAEFRTWGVDPLEQERTLPGDDIVPAAEAVDTRGIDIAAPPEKVWPWLVQMGYGRAGWYSYDELDMNHSSAEELVPALQHVKVGDVFPTHPGGGFVVKLAKPAKALVLYADRELVEAQARDAAEDRETLESASANVRATGKYLDASMPGNFQASWAFILEPLADGGTRLIERFRGRMELPDDRTASFAPRLGGKALLFGLFVMVRRQMLGIRDRAEGRPISHAPWREIALRAREKAMAAADRARAADAGRILPDVAPAPEAPAEPFAVPAPA